MPLTLLNSFDKFNRIAEMASKGEGPASVFGLSEAHRAHIISGLFFSTKKTILYCLPTDSDCIKFEESLKAYSTPVLHFPAKSMTLDNVYAFSGGTVQKRIEALMQLLSMKNCVVLVSAETLMQKLAPKDALISSVIEIKTGESYDLYQLISRLVAAGYSRSDVCEAKGQFTVRGGRLDVFPINYDLPYRIEFFDEEVDTMRTFSIDTQRAIENVDGCIIYPYSEVPISDEVRIQAAKKLARIDKTTAKHFEDNDISGDVSRFLPILYERDTSILDYIPNDSIILIDEPKRFVDSLQTEYQIFASSVEAALDGQKSHTFLWKLLFTPNEAISLIDSERTVMFFLFAQTFNQIRPKEIIQFEARNANSYYGNENMLYSDLLSYKHNGYKVMLFAGERAKRLHELLTANGIFAKYSETPTISDNECVVIPKTLPQGFEYSEYKFVVISEAELFAQGYKKPAPKASKKSAAERLTVEALNIGDYVVHEVHGIGKYLGVETVTAASTTRDYIVLQYYGSDRLYIPTDQLDKVQKYISADDGAAPNLSKLGTGEWQRTVSKVKSSVKALAFDLVKLYADRLNKQGYAFSPDSVWQRELENSFPYEETPDQVTAAEEIKQDMESPKIMDRLLCGDVGFGKTEVALRAAFKAAMDSKQVAFLVPTTILAHQHYNTLKTRFMGFPITVDYLSRFKTHKEQEETLKKLREGKIDVLIGTHRMLSKDVKFKDLGLLIIDEEQRFGVAHKEQIKELKKTVDVLALTATPIPRTLHMSLIGVRDISVIETPPETRYPVQTFVMEYSEALVKEAIYKEVARGGQVFFLYNNVRNMSRFLTSLQKLLPDIRIKMAHGQMPKTILENTMLEFLEGSFDVLLCSTIIENGLDMPNVNTIIVYDADKFGLSQLYQLKGRVGRSTRLGYAYFTFQKNKVFTEAAQKRLMAIREFTQLGMGHKIALRDLQIRGAGNLLGPEQHGHMAAIGYEMYRRIMSEAIQEAKGKKPREIKKAETVMEVPLDAYIPKKYIPNEEWRLSMYKRIAAIESADDVFDVKDELLDRFGDIPETVNSLLDIAFVKSKAQMCFISKLRIVDEELKLTFAANSPYDTEKLIALINSHMNLKLLHEEEETKLRLIKRGANVKQLLKEASKLLDELKSCIEA